MAALAGAAYLAATFGWLCVETFFEYMKTGSTEGSHLRVAVC